MSEATPHHAEQAVLGGLLLDNGARVKLNGVSARDFGAPENRIIFRAILDEIDDKGVADAVSVFERLRRNGEAERAGGLAYLNALAANTPSAANVGRYADLVHQAGQRRVRVGLYAELMAAANRGERDGEAAILRQLSDLPDGEHLPRALSLHQLSQNYPSPPPFIIADWLPAGQVTLLAGDGGTGKSAIALMLCVCIASGRDFYGLTTMRRRVCFLSLEDDANALHWRLRRICDWLGLSLVALEAEGWLHIFDGADGDAALITQTREGLRLTDLYHWLRAQVSRRRLQVLAIDNASDAFDANENERRSVRRFIRALRQLIPPDGAVLLPSHVDKQSTRNPETASGYSGSTGWNNSVRSRWFLREEGEGGALLLEVLKVNFAAKGSTLRLNWSDSAHLFVGELTMPASRMKRDLAELDEREAVLEIVRKAEAGDDPLPTATRGERSAFAVATAHGLPDTLKAKRSRVRFYEHLEALRIAKAIRIDAITRPNRHKAEVYRSSRPVAPATERCSSNGTFA